MNILVKILRKENEKHTSTLIKDELGDGHLLAH